jgi:predicted small lipoprotein YifL
VQRLLQIHDDLTRVRKSQRNHGADALIVDVGVGRIVQAVARLLHGFEQKFCLVKKLGVGHYNLRMFHAQILVRMIALGALVAVLGACGQKGALYLPTRPALAPTTTPALAASAAAPQRPSSTPSGALAAPTTVPAQ